MLLCQSENMHVIRRVGGLEGVCRLRLDSHAVIRRVGGLEVGGRVVTDH